MTKLKSQKSLLTNLCFLLPLVYTIVSCSSTRNGTACSEIENTLSSYQLSNLEKQKKELNEESVEIVKALNVGLRNPGPYSAAATNNLFENLKGHFYIDGIYEKLYLNSTTDSIKLYALQKLMESADFYYTLFYENKPVRRIINRGDKAHYVTKNSLDKSLKLLTNKKNQQIAQKLKWEVNQNPSNIILEQQLSLMEENTYQFIGVCSEAFSRVVTKLDLQKKNKSGIKQLLPHLKKWDIVCQKSRYRLTDLLIPGYFGHAGIYMGDNTFIECSQKGVYYSNANYFLEGSEFIVLRPKATSIDREKHMETLVEAQLGKEYDFNFNIESPDRLTCTELIFLVYDHINWDNRSAMFWETISPDDLVKTSIKNENLDIPVFLASNKLIENPEDVFIEKLLTQK